MNQEEKELVARFLAGEELSAWNFIEIAGIEDLPEEVILKLVNTDEWDYYPDDSDGEVEDLELRICDACLLQPNLNAEIIDAIGFGSGFTEDLTGEKISITDRFGYFGDLIERFIDSKLISPQKIEQLARNIFAIDLEEDAREGWRVFDSERLIEILASIQSNYAISEKLSGEIDLKKAELALLAE